jgi:hypothetical protein
MKNEKYILDSNNILNPIYTCPRSFKPMKELIERLEKLSEKREEKDMLNTNQPF